ncbi:hypothetical protein HK097_011493 [Rhizophlyctis rosea]|uniref:Kinesin motor domain-containing protein n=1 Tax=Rhizophlyctis rosea TaxID=64517 RepID=A0AAD5S7S0_9FUNG|nr:hypothetical protein HK097_011493 [Rhizophlyctis rosea]
MAAAGPEQIALHATFLRDSITTHIQTLASAAEKENSSSTEAREISVYLRTRPLLPNEIERNSVNAAVVHGDDLILYKPEINYKGPRISPIVTQADASFGPEDGNQRVYQLALAELIPLTLGGGLGSVFAYGQTGSGKTYTMSGMQELVAADVFRLAEERGGHYEFKFAAFELLGNDVRDLLDNRKPLKILEDKFGNVEVPDAKDYIVTSKDQYLQLVTAAAALRATESTLKNDTSSRSHAVYRLTCRNTRLPSVKEGTLYLLDLAGSESTRDSKEHDKARLLETREINRSLMTLKDCIRSRALASTRSSAHIHIPYRQSKLTLLLKDAFELSAPRHCRTAVIAHVSPNLLDASHSANTLKYVAPLKIPPPTTAPRPDPDDPQIWTHETARSWVRSKIPRSAEMLPNILVREEEAGLQLAAMSEEEFMERCLSTGVIGEKKAKAVYLAMWKLVVDARLRRRERETGGGKVKVVKKVKPEAYVRFTDERVEDGDEKTRVLLESHSSWWDGEGK